MSNYYAAAANDEIAALHARLDKLNELDRLAALKHLDVLRERDEAIARAEKAEADAIEWERKYQAAVLAFGELMASRERLAAYVRATDALSDVGKPSCVGPLSDWVGYHRHRAAARAAVDAAGDLGGAS